MPDPGRHLSDDQRRALADAIRFAGRGATAREVAARFRSATGLDVSRKTIDDHRRRIGVERARHGRPNKLNDDQIDTLASIRAANPTATLDQLRARLVAATGVLLGKESIRKQLLVMRVGRRVARAIDSLV